MMLVFLVRYSFDLEYNYLRVSNIRWMHYLTLTISVLNHIN